MAVAQKSEPRARVQVVTPRTSRKINKARSRKSKAGAVNIGKAFKSAASLARPAALLAGVVIVIVGYKALANSPLFEVRAIDRFAVGADATLESMRRQRSQSAK